MAATGATRSFGRSAGTLSAGVGAAGLLTYAYFAFASHNLDSNAYGEIVVLWSAVFVTISVLHRPVEQLISRSVAERRTRGAPIAPVLRAAAKIQGLVALGFAAVALALKGTLRDDLLSGSTTLYWVYVTAVLAFAASFFARGYLAGEGHFGLLAGLLVSESFSRMAFALAVAVGIAAGRDAIAAGIVAAPLFSLSVVPLALGRRAVRAPAGAAATPGDESSRTVLARGGAFASAVLLIMLSEQIFLNAGPLLVHAIEGSAQAGFIFNVLMLARAPLLVFQGIAISLLPHLTRLRSRGHADADEAFSVSVELTLRAIAAFTLFVVAIVAIAGPKLMQIAFSDRFTYDRLGLLLVTAAMGLYLASTTLNQAALARGLSRRAAACWIGCAAGFLVWSLLPILSPARRIEVGFLAAAAALFALLLRLYRAHAEEGEIDSTDELEAALARADEAS
jgi:O-antigen/teichoic acid export membrane protein